MTTEDTRIVGHFSFRTLWSIFIRTMCPSTSEKDPQIVVRSENFWSFCGTHTVLEFQHIMLKSCQLLSKATSNEGFFSVLYV